MLPDPAVVDVGLVASRGWAVVEFNGAVVARENMAEWGSSAVIAHESIKAVVEAWAEVRTEQPTA